MTTQSQNDKAAVTAFKIVKVIKSEPVVWLEAQRIPYMGKNGIGNISGDTYVMFPSYQIPHDLQAIGSKFLTLQDGYHSYIGKAWPISD